LLESRSGPKSVIMLQVAPKSSLRQTVIRPCVTAKQVCVPGMAMGSPGSDGPWNATRLNSQFRPPFVVRRKPAFETGFPVESAFGIASTIPSESFQNVKALVVAVSVTGSHVSPKSLEATIPPISRLRNNRFEDGE